VWIVNGFLCKILNLVPRHQQIVARIIGDEYSFVSTKLIGLSELVLAAWFLSGFKRRLNVISQILLIQGMNIVEFFLASDLLLWGKNNIIFAFIFSLLIYWNEFVLNKEVNKS